MSVEWKIAYKDLPALRMAIELLCSPSGAGTKDDRPVFLPVALAGRVARVRRLCREAVEEYEELKTGLIRKYGESQADGSFGVSTRNESFLNFREELRELDKMSFTIDRAITRAEIENEFEAISPVVLDGLEPIFSQSQSDEVEDVRPINTAAGRRKAKA